MEFNIKEMSGLFDKWMETRDSYKNKRSDFEQGKCQAYSEVLTDMSDLIDKKMEEHINELLDKGMNEQDIIGEEYMTAKFTEKELKKLVNDWRKSKEYYEGKDDDFEKGKAQAYGEVLDDISYLVSKKRNKEIMSDMRAKGLID